MSYQLVVAVFINPFNAGPEIFRGKKCPAVAGPKISRGVGFFSIFVCKSNVVHQSWG